MATVTLSQPRSDPQLTAPPTSGFTPVTESSVTWLNQDDPQRHIVSAPQASQPVPRKDNTAVALLLAVVILLGMYLAASQLIQRPVQNKPESTTQDTSIDNTPSKPVVNRDEAPVLVPTAGGGSVYCPAPGSPVAKYVRGTAWMPPACWRELGLPVPNYQQ